MISYATDQTYQEMIKEGCVIVDFFTTTCVPCRMFAGVLENIADDYPSVKIVKADISQNQLLGMENDIAAVPTVLFMRDGIELEKVVGLMSEDEVADKIQKYFHD